MTIGRSLIFLALSALLACGCGNEVVPPEPPPPFVEAEAKIIEFTSAQAYYYGDDGNTEQSDMWNLRLSCPECFVQISCNTLLADELTPDCLVGYYTASSKDGYYSPDSFNPGYILKIELPDETIEGPAMSYFGQHTLTGEVNVDLLREGFVNIDMNSDGTFVIEGSMVGQKFLKRNFIFEGDLDFIDLTVSSETKSSNDSGYEINFEMLSDIMPFDFGVYKAGQWFRK